MRESTLAPRRVLGSNESLSSFWKFPVKIDRYHRADLIETADDLKILLRFCCFLSEVHSNSNCTVLPRPVHPNTMEIQTRPCTNGNGLT